MLVNGLYGIAVMIKVYANLSTLSSPLDVMFLEQILMLENVSGNCSWTDFTCLVNFL